MGTVQHDCVIAVGNDLQHAKDWIAELPLMQQEVFIITRTTSEPVDIIIMRPDGSKHGWATSDLYDRVRNRFIQKLRRCKWVHVSFGELGLEIKSNVQKIV